MVYRTGPGGHMSGRSEHLGGSLVHIDTGPTIFGIENRFSVFLALQYFHLC